MALMYPLRRKGSNCAKILTHGSRVPLNGVTVALLLESAQAAATKCNKLDVGVGVETNHRNLFFTFSRLEFKSMVPACWELVKVHFRACR